MKKIALNAPDKLLGDFCYGNRSNSSIVSGNLTFILPAEHPSRCIPTHCIFH